MNASTPLPHPVGDTTDTPRDPAERLHQLWLRGERPEVGSYLAGLRTLLPAQVAAVLRVDAKDQNGREATEDVFELDTDKDGKLSREEAVAYFEDMIFQSINAWGPVVIDRLHSLTQGWRT